MGSRLSCRELVDFLADYLEGQLSETRRDLFDAHLAGCPSCVSYVRSYQDTVRLGREAFLTPDDTLPTDVPADLLQAILDIRKRS